MFKKVYIMYCPVCGYVDGEHTKTICPFCGRELSDSNHLRVMPPFQHSYHHILQSRSQAIVPDGQAATQSTISLF